MASSTFDTILEQVGHLPEDEQRELVRAIVDRIYRAYQATERQSQPFIPSERLRGIGSNGQRPPTDEEVAQWLDEHRMEKYG